MRKKTAQRILQEGSVPEKIRLYFTDTAHFNITGGESILTEDERDFIMDEIVKPRHDQYYRECQRANRAFVVMMPYIQKGIAEVRLTQTHLMHYTTRDSLSKSMDKLINGIVNETGGDLREKIEEYIDKFIKKEKDLQSFIVHKGAEELMVGYVKKFNHQRAGLKLFIEALRVFTQQHLPVKPYLKWLNAQDKEVKHLIEELPTLKEAVEDITKEKVINYNDIEVEVTEQHLSMIANAGT